MVWTDWAWITVVCSLALIAIALFHWVEFKTSFVEEVITDPEDPAVKRETEKRTNFLNPILQHLEFDLGFTRDNLENNATIDHLSPTISSMRIANGDMIATLIIKWNKSVQFDLYRNKDCGGNHVFKGKKTFKVRNNKIDDTAVAKFLKRFYDRAYKIEFTNEESYNECALAAKEIAEETEEDVVLKVATSQLLKFDISNFKHPKEASVFFTTMLAMMLKFHKDDFLAEVRKNTEEEES